MISRLTAVSHHMNTKMCESLFRVPLTPGHGDLLNYFSRSIGAFLPDDAQPIRFVVSKTDETHYDTEVGFLTERHERIDRNSIFDLRRRGVEHEVDFNAVLLVPTGIGAEIGGHAGDAAPVARLLSGACDNLILHPNVVNASDINEMPSNSLYVEGSVITRLLMGAVGIKKTRSNRVLLIIDAHKDEDFVSAAINSANAARASSGNTIARVIKLDPPVELTSRYSDSGRATGSVSGLDQLIAVIEEFHHDIDAVAISSVIRVPPSYHMDYFRCEGDMLNPWGGVEALLTHSISTLTNLPTAHSPMFEAEWVANLKPGIVDSRMAAEAVSFTFLNCILKGLQRSPQVIVNPNVGRTPGLLTVEDISCLVIPDGCLGLPTLAALEQGIPVIAVEENTNIMRNDLTALPWQPGKFFKVRTYLEAVGVMVALREGLPMESLKRPIHGVPVELRSFGSISPRPSQEVFWREQRAKQGGVATSFRYISRVKSPTPKQQQ